MTKSELIAALSDAGVHFTAAHAKSTKKAELESILESALENIAEAEDNDEKELSMSDHMKKYRENYTKSKTASGTASMHNGSKLAILLSGSTPEAVVATAERVLDLKSGELATKYAHLNPGSRRMNAGNRLKFALKRGDIKMDDIAKALAS